MAKTKKKILGLIKLQIPAGKANPSPPVGPALGQKGLNIMEFCKAFNAATQKMEQQADEMDADAIVGVNYSSMSMADGAAAVMVSGTAVKFV